MVGLRFYISGIFFFNFYHTSCAVSASSNVSNDNGRFYTRGRIIRLDELGQTFVVRPVMRL